MHRLQLEPCCQRACVTPEQRDNLGWKLEGSETRDVLPSYRDESVTCAPAALARLDAPAHFCTPLASESRTGSGRRA
jgi:hypothetical protein